MDAVLRLVLAVLVGAVVAMGVPREIGREYRWSVAWEQFIDMDITEAAVAKPSDSRVEYVPVETDRRFSLIDSDSGDVVVAGLKTQTYLASSQALINQAADAPRWAVQSWSGEMLVVVPRRGVPRLHGATLLQFDGDSTVHGDVATRGERWSLELPANPTVYDLARDASGREWFAAGSLGGTIAVTNGGGEQWGHTLETGSEAVPSSSIYGIHVAEDRGSAGTVPHSLSMHLLHGLNPQYLSRLDFPENGEVDHRYIAEVPAQYAVHSPRLIFEPSQDLLVVGLPGAIFVARIEKAEPTLLPVDGLIGLTGMRTSADDLTVATGNGRGSSIILVGPRDMSAVAYWELADSSLVAEVVESRLSDGRVVVQGGARLVGIELTL